jgi:GPI ethanolamine phosphate transferase 3 subunit O
MPTKPATPRKEASIPSTSDPVAKVGDYKSIAAQYAKAKALKEKEDTAAAKNKSGGVRKVNGQASGGNNAKAPMTDSETINKRKEGVFKKAWNSSLGFFVWLL